MALLKLSKKILLVEDDPILGSELELGLRLEGFDVTWAKSFQEAKETYATGAFDLISLEIGLPDGSGMDLCKEIRKGDTNVLIIFLTNKTDEETVVRGLDLGANDFIKKPFSQKELLARIKVLLRMSSWQSNVDAGGLTLNPERREVSFNGQSLDLNRRQFEILSYFLARPDQIVTREQLLNYLGQDGAIFDRTVDSHVSQLRKSMKNAGIDSVLIAPIYGVGYRLELH